MNYKILKNNRIGNHIWWISDLTKFRKDYKNWKFKYNLEQIIDEIIFGIKKIVCKLFKLKHEKKIV